MKPCAQYRFIKRLNGAHNPNSCPIPTGLIAEDLDHPAPGAVPPATACVRTSRPVLTLQHEAQTPCLDENSEMDVESLQKSGHRRSSRLNVFLVVSVIFLFVAVAAVAAGGVMVVMELRSKLQPPSFDFETVKLTGRAPYPESKMNNCAYLRAKSGELKNSTAMQWTPVHYGGRTTVGSNFLFEKESLTLKQVGIYFMYIELNFTCTFRCSAAVLSVRVGDKLTCNVQLPDVTNQEPVPRKCWTVSHLKEQTLQTQMTVPEDGLPYWKLELNGSGLGIFLVD